MNILTAIVTSAFVLILSVGQVAGEDTPKLRNIRIVPPSTDFRKNLNGVSEWNLGKGLVLNLRMNGETTEFVGEDGKVLHSIDGPESVRQAVSSDSSLCVLFAIWRNGNYSRLIRVTSSEGRLNFHSFWSGDDNLIPGHRWWVHELGAISDDGMTVLAKFGEDGQPNNRILYRWQTWELEPAKRVGIGLTVANGRSKE